MMFDDSMGFRVFDESILLLFFFLVVIGIISQTILSWMWCNDILHQPCAVFNKSFLGLYYHITNKVWGN